MKTGTSRASACAEVDVIFSMSGSGVHSGSREFDQRRAELLAEHALDLPGAGRDDRLGRLVARTTAIDSRMMPMRMPLSEPAAPETLRVAQHRAWRAPTSAARW